MKRAVLFICFSVATAFVVNAQQDPTKNPNISSGFLLYQYLTFSKDGFYTYSNGRINVKLIDKVYNVDDAVVNPKPTFDYKHLTTQQFFSNYANQLKSELLDLSTNKKKYVRVYFEFVVDKYGAANNAKFLKAEFSNDLSFSDVVTKEYSVAESNNYSKAINKVIIHMPFWKNGFIDYTPVDVLVKDYFQFEIE